MTVSIRLPSARSRVKHFAAEPRFGGESRRCLAMTTRASPAPVAWLWPATSVYRNGPTFLRPRGGPTKCEAAIFSNARTARSNARTRSARPSARHRTIELKYEYVAHAMTAITAAAQGTEGLAFRLISNKPPQITLETAVKATAKAPAQIMMPTARTNLVITFRPPEASQSI